MALSYVELVTTQANMLADIRAAILASSDWSRPNAAAKPSLYKCTTDRGADMIFDLEDVAATLAVLTIGVWQSHDGTTGVGKTTRYLFSRNTVSGVTGTEARYCTVSAGKNHIFIMIEGPRPAETGAEVAQVGSARTYFFLSDLVPYHASDNVPVVIVGGAQINSLGSTVANNNHQAAVSKNKALLPWNGGKLISLDFPTMFTADTIAVTRQCAWDNNYYLFPYVYVDDADGMRGRLAAFHFAGYNQTSDNSEIASAPVGSKVQFEGQWYKLVNVTKGNANQTIWGQFGTTSNSSVATSYRSPVVAIPCPAP